MSDAPVVVYEPAIDARFAPAKRSLKENEEIIRRGLTSFVEVGNALKDVRDSGQFLEEGYESFGDYCKDRWEIARPTADLKIGAAGVYEAITEDCTCSVLPENEGQVRPLAPLWRSRVEPEMSESEKEEALQEGAKAVRRVWNEIVDAHASNGPITSREVRAHLNPGVSVSPGQRSISDAYLTALDKVNDALTSVNWAIKKGQGKKVPRPVAERYAAYAAAADELAQAIRLAGDEKTPAPLTRVPGKGYGSSS